MSDDPYRAEARGPLEVEVDLGGKTKLTRYHLSMDALRMESVAGSVPAKQIALADVVHVQLITLGGTTVCTLRARNGEQLALSSGMATPQDQRAERAFASLLEALNERIAQASPSAAFVTGSWWVTGSVLTAMLLAGGTLAWLGSDPVTRNLLKFKLGCVLVAVILLIGLPLALIRGRPKPYDPRKIPRRYDPAPR